MFKFLAFILLIILVSSCSSQKEVKNNKKEAELEIKKELKINKNTEITQIYFLKDEQKYPSTSKFSQIQITSNTENNQNLTKEYDFNSDGKMDMMFLYNKDGSIDKIYSDLDFDLKHDVIDYYKNNKINKRELLSDLTKKPYITIIYDDNGKIKTSLFDRNLDGKADQKSLYKNGELYEIKIDSNSDGIFNLTKKVKAKKIIEEDGK